MILVINTADAEEIYIALIEKGETIVSKKFKAKYKQAEKLLPAISNFIPPLGGSAGKRNNLAKIHTPFRGDPIYGGLSGIGVVTGPGSFSALRLGISVANTLAWSLKLPIVGIKKNEFENIEQLSKLATAKLQKAKVGSIIEPFYGREPNITIKN